MASNVDALCSRIRHLSSASDPADARRVALDVREAIESRDRRIGKLLDEDVERLLKQPRTLERDHIAAVLREAPGLMCPPAPGPNLEACYARIEELERQLGDAYIAGRASVAEEEAFDDAAG